MNSDTEKIQSPPHKNKLANRWIHIAILLVLLLLGISGVTAACSSNAPIPGNLPVTENPTSTAAAPSTATVPATAVVPAAVTVPAASQPTPSETAAATATSTSSPTATQAPTQTPTPTPAPSATPGPAVVVSMDAVKLRSGPGTNFDAVRQLSSGEQVTLMGRMDDSSWVYVETSAGETGWLASHWVDLRRVDVDTVPVETPIAPPETMVKLLENSNLRTGPGTFFSSIQRLAYGDQLKLVGRLNDGSWIYVQTADGQEGWVQTGSVDHTAINFDYSYYPVLASPPTETSTPVVLTDVEGRWIDVDLSEQRLRAYEGTELVATFLVSTGLTQYPTEVGKYHVYAKFRYINMTGSDYYLPDVPWNLFYSGDFSIHGTYWHHNFGTPMSHGCVNMDIRDAEWLYNWAEIGTLVNVHI